MSILDLFESLEGMTSLDQNVAIRFQVRLIDEVLSEKEIAEALNVVRYATVDRRVEKALESYNTFDEHVRHEIYDILNEVYWIAYNNRLKIFIEK